MRKIRPEHFVFKQSLCWRLQAEHTNTCFLHCTLLGKISQWLWFVMIPEYLVGTPYLKHLRKKDIKRGMGTDCFTLGIYCVVFIKYFVWTINNVHFLHMSKRITSYRGSLKTIHTRMRHRTTLLITYRVIEMMYELNFSRRKRNMNDVTLRNGIAFSLILHYPLAYIAYTLLIFYTKCENLQESCVV